MKYQVECCSIFEVGQRKDADGEPHQEDCLFPTYGLEDNTNRLFILCDGMGGHKAGEVASATVCKAISGSLMPLYGKTTVQLTDDHIINAINAAYDALDSIDNNSKSSKKMGTTMTCLAFHDDGATIAHIGDSRVYHIRPSKDGNEARILFQTRDHSLVNDLVTIGEITSEEARTHPHRNVITRVMQPHQEYRSPPDIMHISDIRKGDYFYLCSDGMLEKMDNDEICQLFSRKSGDIDEKKKRLLDATKDNTDNHSAFLVQITKTQKCVLNRITNNIFQTLSNIYYHEKNH